MCFIEVLSQACETSPKQPSKREISADFPPCLDLGKGGRGFRGWAKIEHPPETKKGQKMELVTDSLATEKTGRWVGGVKHPKTEGGETPSGTTSERGLTEWLGEAGYQR